MQNLEKKNRELLEEIEKLKRKNKSLKSRKKYGLVWEEEKEPEQIVKDCQIKIPFLIENRNEMIIKEKSKGTNILIEGDNYHALSVLNYTHKKSIDVIYIDPPYNTGNNDFIYNDKIVNTEDNYRHSKWISFMYHRLKLAKELLTDEGAIFISIDDNELYNLKLLCDEIFEEHNFIANFVRKNKSGSAHDSSAIAIEFDYMLCYAKDKGRVTFNKEIMDVENDPKYKLEDKHVKNRGKYYIRDLDYKGSYSPSLDYGIETPDGTIIWSGGKEGRPNTWRWSKPKFEWGIENDFIVFKKTQVKWKVYIKQYQFVDNENKIRVRKIPYRALIDFSNSKGSQQLRKLLEQNIFNYPKPTELIKFILGLIPKNDCIILDFFAGSGTTGQATIEFNSETAGDRRFILCTNNENDICTKVCYPRLKKLIDGYTDAKGKLKGHFAENIRYFKTELMDINHIAVVSDEHKIELTYKVGDMIALREDTFEEVEKNEWWQVFTNGEKHTAIYFKEDKRKLSELISKLSKFKEKVVLYIFSWGKNEYKNEYSEYQHIEIRDIPEPIIDVYKDIWRL